MATNLEIWKKNLLGNYGLPPITICRGNGSFAWDDAGKKYLDFASGIAVLSLGHAHPHWLRRVREQSEKLVHCSNYFGNENAPRLAEKINAHMGGGKVFFCNSGAEANEALIKLSRLHGMKKAGGNEGKIFKIVTCENAFHGRLFGTMAATPQEKIQHGFRPLIPNISVAKLNDIESFKHAIDAETSAVILEVVQGESGLTPAVPAFLKELRELCSEKNVLLFCDEVQCGIGRTGALFAFEQAGVVPDAFSMAKGLGGGFPIGAMWCKDEFAEYFHAGMHGTTFGGNPLATAAALAVFEVFEEENLLENVKNLAPEWRKNLQKIADAVPEKILEIRGIGFMSGLKLSEAPAPWISKIREAGMLCVAAGNNVIRLLPPLNATKSELELSVEILKKVFVPAAK